jgi:hypothetical protein
MSSLQGLAPHHVLEIAEAASRCRKLMTVHLVLYAQGVRGWHTG